MPRSPTHCATCRAAITAGTYYRCSVSSCNSGKMKLRFCSTACWDAHVPTARHRNATCIEESTSVQARDD